MAQTNRAADGTDRASPAHRLSVEPGTTRRPLDIRRSQGRKKGRKEEPERGTFWRGTTIETDTRLRVGRAIAKTEEEVAQELMKQIKRLVAAFEIKKLSENSKVRHRLLKSRCRA